MVEYPELKLLVYAAVNEDSALQYLDDFAEKWDSKYPKIAMPWKAHWAELSTYFKYPESIRTLIYTTNTIKGLIASLGK